MGKDKIAISWSSACAGAKKGNFPPHDGVSERLWTAIHLPEIPTRNYKASEHWGSLEHAPLGKGSFKGGVVYIISAFISVNAFGSSFFPPRALGHSTQVK